MKHLNTILVIAVVLLLATTGVVLRIIPLPGSSRQGTVVAETVYVCRTGRNRSGRSGIHLPDASLGGE